MHLPCLKAASSCRLGIQRMPNLRLSDNTSPVARVYKLGRESNSHDIQLFVSPIHVDMESVPRLETVSLRERLAGNHFIAPFRRRDATVTQENLIQTDGRIAVSIDTSRQEAGSTIPGMSSRTPCTTRVWRLTPPGCSEYER